MAKASTKQVPAKKLSKEDKQATKTAQAAAKTAAAKPAKIAKPKGTIPASYAPNLERQLTREEQAHNAIAKERAEREALHRDRAIAKLAACQEAYPAFLNGIAGDYTIALVGGGEDGRDFFETYRVDMHVMPATDKSSEKKMLVIYGHKDVRISHADIFKPENFKPATGWVGAIQRKMLGFITKALEQEIAGFNKKPFSFATMQAQTSPAVTGPTLATVDGKAVKPAESNAPKAPQELKLRRLLDFSTEDGTDGKWSIPDGKNRQVMITKTMEDGKSTIRVVNIHPDHELAQAGIKVGQFIRTVSLREEIPMAVADEYGAEFFAHASMLKAFILLKLASRQAPKEQMTA